jgi:hypothetical protein
MAPVFCRSRRFTFQIGVFFELVRVRGWTVILAQGLQQQLRVNFDALGNIQCKPALMLC